MFTVPFRCSLGNHLRIVSDVFVGTARSIYSDYSPHSWNGPHSFLKFCAEPTFCTMKLSTLPVLAALSCLLSATTVVADEAAELSALLGQAASDILASLQAEEEALNKRGLEATCNVKNIAIRQELQVLQKLTLTIDLT